VAVLVSDSFNRANSTTTLGSTDSYNGGTAKVWTNQDTTGTWGINTNRAYVQTDAQNRMITVVSSGISNGTVEADITWATGAYVGLNFRNTDLNNFFDICINSTSLVLRKYVSGSSTTLGTYNFTAVNGTIYHIAATFNGSTITISLDGVQRITVTDSFNSTATLHGLRSPTSVFNAYYDNFVVSDLSTGGTDATVTGIIATSTADVLAPVISAQQQPTITGVIANSSVDTIAPIVSTVSSVSTNIDMLVATVTADTLNPSVITDSVITSIISDAIADIVIPSLSVSSQITSPFGSTTADTINPSISLSGSITIQAIITDTTVGTINPILSIDSNLLGQIVISNADVLPPNVGSFTNITINSIITNATSDTNIPIVAADRNISIVSSVVNATADILTPTVGSSSSTQITSVITTVTVDGIAPSISISQGSLINSVVVGLSADTIIPMIQTDITISAFISNSQAVSLTPALFQNYIEYKQIIEYVMKINPELNVTVGIAPVKEFKLKI
jgi:hypothetical protein